MPALPVARRWVAVQPLAHRRHIQVLLPQSLVKVSVHIYCHG
jgi:hypothetical protein